MPNVNISVPQLQSGFPVENLRPYLNSVGQSVNVINKRLTALENSSAAGYASVNTDCQWSPVWNRHNDTLGVRMGYATINFSCSSYSRSYTTTSGSSEISDIKWRWNNSGYSEISSDDGSTWERADVLHVFIKLTMSIKSDGTVDILERVSFLPKAITDTDWNDYKPGRNNYSYYNTGSKYCSFVQPIGYFDLTQKRPSEISFRSSPVFNVGEPYSNIKRGDIIPCIWLDSDDETWNVTVWATYPFMGRTIGAADSSGFISLVPEVDVKALTFNDSFLFSGVCLYSASSGSLSGLLSAMPQTFYADYVYSDSTTEAAGGWAIGDVGNIKYTGYSAGDDKFFRRFTLANKINTQDLYTDSDCVQYYSYTNGLLEVYNFNPCSDCPPQRTDDDPR